MSNTKAGVVVDLDQSMGPGCETRKSGWSDVESDVRRSMARARWAILIFLRAALETRRAPIHALRNGNGVWDVGC